jgi:hypothetical protein
MHQKTKRKGHVKLLITAVTTIARPKKVLLQIINSYVHRIHGNWLNRWDGSCQQHYYKPDFPQKKGEPQSGRSLCSPQERSLVRKMGSNYSPQLISKKLRTKSVSNEITTVVVER